jgi:hypothetical protein
MDVTKEEKKLAKAENMDQGMVSTRSTKATTAREQRNQSKDFAVPGAGRTLIWKKSGQTFSAPIVRLYDEGRFLVRHNGEEVTIRTEKVPEWKDQGENKNVADSYVVT